jgi:hypothetical protein
VLGEHLHHIGPAMGLEFRHHVRGYALEQRRRPGFGNWNEILLLDNGELAEVIGDAGNQHAAVERAEAWLRDDRYLTPRFRTDPLV